MVVRGFPRAPAALPKPLCSQRPGPFLSPWAVFAEGGTRNSKKTQNLITKHRCRAAFISDMQNSTSIWWFPVSILGSNLAPHGPRHARTEPPKDHRTPTNFKATPEVSKVIPRSSLLGRFYRHGRCFRTRWEQNQTARKSTKN